MSDDLDLYQDILLSHTKRPRNRGTLDRPTHRGEGYNALCGDEVLLTLRVEGGKIAEVQSTGPACAICTASASILTTHVQGHTPNEALALGAELREALKGGSGSTDEKKPSFSGDIEMETLAHVGQFPQRVKCAALAWETLAAALKNGAVSQPPPEPTLEERIRFQAMQQSQQQ